MLTVLEHGAEILGGFYAVVAAWIALVILGRNIADRLDRRFGARA